MRQCPRPTHLLVLPRLRVQNANAISSPLTHGFPSMTAFLGLMWALERKAVKAGIDHVAFNAVGVVSHGWQEQTTQDGFIKSFRLTRNPVDKDGSTAAIVEEGRIHLDLSLVFALTVEDWNAAQQSTDVAMLVELVSGMRVAGGTVMPQERAWQPRYQAWVVDLTGDSEVQQKEFRKTCVRLLPGSALVARDDLIDQRWDAMRDDDPNATRLDAWLSLSRLEWHYDDSANTGKGAWQSLRRKGGGWIVPIPVGYGALSDLHPPGSVRHARDAETRFRFVESLYGVGEWVGTHRLRTPQQLLWYAHSDEAQGLYRCRNDYASSVSHD
ncbi:MAG TPA: type I-F CRISPR-associated protein Csy2 [Aquimonas sp.]|nr:type I-F CRISPR-associated protein Csy2 [Aquimonas sp.]HRF53722.1 type I-F CRISPR-associated protein Csy2 [Aquimonas sp.]